MPAGTGEIEEARRAKRVRTFVESTRWTFAKTYAGTWPHEYVVRNDENAAMILAIARHIFEHGTDGRFYSQVRKYHHEGGKVYWSMAATPEEATLINRCDENQTYRAASRRGLSREREGPPASWSVCCSPVSDVAVAGS